MSDGRANEQKLDKHSEPFENFKKLTKKLLTVPKEEADKEKASYKRKKEGRKRDR